MSCTSTRARSGCTCSRGGSSSPWAQRELCWSRGTRLSSMPGCHTTSTCSPRKAPRCSWSRACRASTGGELPGGGPRSRDGIPPGELLRIAREQLEPYAGVEVRKARAVRAARSGGDFEVALEDSSTVGTRRILLATGVHDELPERPGFRELWGRGIFHCPYCHGWEVRDGPLAVPAKAEALAM